VESIVVNVNAPASFNSNGANREKEKKEEDNDDDKIERKQGSKSDSTAKFGKIKGANNLKLLSLTFN
jgi:hypothetical protein